ncbi:Ankyrin repeat and LEM domain-containing protein 1 [Frankliniella fusca]|uniref:Ankyrin repeat and LEM domain-containing protein 1 n=1 Tax=Frankliniella fusca TaxID=407009 RepID=A0AAE1GQ68_9NEOP|nr:Ankyrin repeat and LEM domain-containing protein 1 [Frankliniella fusca]
MSPKGYDKAKQSLALQLIEAVEEKCLQEILRLLDNDRADPNIVVHSKGVSPFHLVIGCECAHFAEETTRIFLQRNGDPNIRSEDGLTPVHVAAVWGRTNLLMLLLSCGGDPWLRDFEHGYTPLHFALKEKQWETALILQKYQLLDRRHHRSEIQSVPRFNMNLETIVVHAGEIKAEYATTPQDAVPPIVCSPEQKPKKVNPGYSWNIDPLESQEYVRQWCHKEFTPLKVLHTSTPTHQKTLKCGNVDSEALSEPVQVLNISPDLRTPNITRSKLMTPKTIDYSTNGIGPSKVTDPKNLLKAPTDVRKKLFLELKKRFSVIKQSFDLSKDDSSKRNIFERSSGYFGRKSFGKSEKIKKFGKSQPSSDEIFTDGNKSNMSENLSYKTSRSVESTDAENLSDPNVKCNNDPSLENSPVDEVDAVPLHDSIDTSVEWIASQSCFSEEASPNSSNSQSYITCDEGPTLDVKDDMPIVSAMSTILEGTPFVPPEQPSEAPQRPPRRKRSKALSSTLAESVPSHAPSAASCGTIISEEYRYTDVEADVVLIENHLFTKPVDVPSPSDTESVASAPQTILSDAPTTAASDVSSVPASFNYDAATLRRELVSLGEVVGPITSTTKKVYLRRLYRLKKNKCMPKVVSLASNYPSELQCVLHNSDWETDVLTYAKYEKLMSIPFERPDSNRRWREGIAKSSFNYLLLDPRLSNNLPAKVIAHDLGTWQQFVSSIFYIGKGKRTRPYAHLYQAVHLWKKGDIDNGSNSKIQRILEIWKGGHGVVCLHIFQNIIPVEAFTREAAMIDAMGINNLVNLKSGEYYGPASTWRIRQKRQLGVFLLYRAMRIFLCEGERQLRPGDID